MLKPQLVVDVPRDLKAMKDAQRLRCNTSSYQLAPIASGTSIRTRLPNQESWTLGDYKEISQTFVLGDCQWANIQMQRTCVTCCQRVSSATRARLSNASTFKRSVDKPSLSPVDGNVPLNGDSPHRDDPVVMHNTPSDDVSHYRVMSSPTRVETSPVRRGTRARKLPAYLADYQPS